jgi:surface carbohydrate biosynthesis protein (TIGR04326 family)
VNAMITNAPLGEVLSQVDVVFASCITSAAVDAHQFGVPVIQMLHGSAFNMSPLRGFAGAVYVTSAEELAAQMKQVLQRGRPNAAESYFFLDEELPRWRRLICEQA